MQRRKLLEFQAFDDASRGPMGSLVLFGKLHGLRLVCLGAAITIVSTFFGPFTQQVVRYPSHPQSIGAAFTTQVFNYTGLFSVFTKMFLKYHANLHCLLLAAAQLGGFPSPLVTASFYEGLALSRTSFSTVTPSCSTGNCTWPLYTSLGVCGNVVDLSSTLQTNACNTTSFNEIFQQLGKPNPGYQCFNYTLPDVVIDIPLNQNDGLENVSDQIFNLYLTNGVIDEYFGPDTLPVLVSSPSYQNTSSLGTFYLIYQPGFLESINVPLPKPLAYGINLDVCTQTFNTTVFNGKVNTTLVSSRILPTYLTEVFTANNDTKEFTASNTYVTIEGDVFGMSEDGMMLLNQAMTSLLTSTCYEIIDDAFSGEDGLGFTAWCDESGPVQILSALDAPDPLAGLRAVWDNLATSVTNR